MLTTAETEAAAALDYFVWDAKRMLAEVRDLHTPSSPQPLQPVVGMITQNGGPDEVGVVPRAAKIKVAHEWLYVMYHAGA